MKTHVKSKLIKAAALIFALVIAFAFVPELAARADSVSCYIDEYAERYSAYAKKHPDKAYEDVIMEVNLHLDEDNYINVVQVKNPASLTVMLNKHYALPKNYKPDNLVKVDENYAQKGVTLRSDCYDAFLLMEADMEKEGLSLYIKSGFRKNVKRGGPDSLQFAWPGHTEHQTGLAFDLCKKGVNYKSLSEYNMQDTDEFAWLTSNAYRYGFIMSFPYSESHLTNFGYEPWHWRFVGADTATRMKKLRINTLAEYWAKYLCKAELEAAAVEDDADAVETTPAPSTAPENTPAPKAVSPTPRAVSPTPDQDSPDKRKPKAEAADKEKTGRERLAE